MSADEWQPIEAAPIDGTLVDLWMQNHNHQLGYREPDCWFEHGQWWQEYGREGPFQPGQYVGDFPTHFMPIPSAPVVKEKP